MEIAARFTVLAHRDLPPREMTSSSAKSCPPPSAALLSLPSAAQVPLGILIVYDGMSWSPECSPELASMSAPAPELAPVSAPAPELAPMSAPAPELSPVSAPAPGPAPRKRPPEPAPRKRLP